MDRAPRCCASPTSGPAQNRQIGTPGPEGSIGKVASAEFNKDIYELCVDLMGAEGMLYGSYAMVRPETAMESDTLQKAFLRARANSIEGGTSEIMRNILGERVLGLPGDVRVDNEVPWSQGRGTDGHGPAPAQDAGVATTTTFCL